MVEGVYEEMMIGKMKRSPERIKGLKEKQEDNVTVGVARKVRVLKDMGSANDTK